MSESHCAGTREEWGLAEETIEEMGLQTFLKNCGSVPQPERGDREKFCRRWLKGRCVRQQAMTLTGLDITQSTVTRREYGSKTRISEQLNRKVYVRRLIFNLRRSDHISNALTSLHWLRVSERILNAKLQGSPWHCMRRGIWDLSPVLPMCQVDANSDLPAILLYPLSKPATIGI